ncbi:GPP34 family phosphoprotein [Streptomyces europaeiscabiei]|uniref:GPP34 family phosphoprotein n=1 Tax=Streptomyces europaeiscabiei TaxID=146819 RepID=A0ABU4N7K3_9ACTN|nr:GPP34 family phosphoprotein [Streptomyces europaeiscabiei]MDX2761265.1 GPP34 family phosphoprotein [Streptomyces europaeiscabiei]MDX3541889.1 GPP34 family phosphoprotein [Streptomyces europaeiscabiei]MDX3550883.1 GPP34 family phosphoprotein [Streptomyces europaeiscabiei]MDX3665107.1 GPP34 family phosphoprotein [Streptomyces europaeiscabiei]MDX3698557.1 GPP34 family phosphoprotein [Streptomyces europaeiscabiei]
MDLTLPQQIYLCAYAFKKNKFPATLLQFRGQRLRAAALTELVLAGQAETDGRRVRALGDQSPTDPFLASVWEELHARPKKWIPLVHNTAHKAEKPVENQLTAAGIIEKKTGLTLSLLGGSKVVLRREEETRTVQEALRTRVTTTPDPSTLPLAQVALPVIALESDATMGVVLNRSERRKHKDTLEELAKKFDREIPGLRKALSNSVLSSRSVGGGWS